MEGAPEPGTIKRKDYAQHFSIKKLQKSLNGDILFDLMQYYEFNEKNSLQKLRLIARVSERDGVPYVEILYHVPKNGPLSRDDERRVKKFLSGQISDGWNENGARFTVRNKKYSVFLKYK